MARDELPPDYTYTCRLDDGSVVAGYRCPYCKVIKVRTEFVNGHKTYQGWKPSMCRACMYMRKRFRYAENEAQRLKQRKFREARAADPVKREHDIQHKRTQRALAKARMIADGTYEEYKKQEAWKRKRNRWQRNRR